MGVFIYETLLGELMIKSMIQHYSFIRKINFYQEVSQFRSLFIEMIWLTIQGQCQIFCFSLYCEGESV
jgi:hypothetical protein